MMEEDRPPEGPEPIPPDHDRTEDESLPEQADRLAALLPAFAFGIADSDEEQYVKAGLADDPEAARELAAYAELAHAMLFSAPVVTPPEGLAERIQAGLTQEPPPARAPVPAAAPAPAPPRRPAWYARLWQPALAALALLLLGLNIYLFVQNQELMEAQRALTQQVARQNQALLLLLESQPQQIVLPAAEGAGAAEATVLWRPGSQIGVLQASNFPPLDPDKAYQLWLVKDGNRSDGGLFTVDVNGNGALVFESPLPIDELDVMGITTEPSSGSPGPTSPPVVRREF
jgi:hypothetical protein